MGLQYASGVLAILLSTLSPTSYNIGVTSIVAQFPDVSPYRWPGWFITTVAVVYVVVVILAFKETHRCGFVMKQVKWSSCVTGIRLSLQLKRFSKTRLIVSSITIINYCCVVIVLNI